MFPFHHQLQSNTWLTATIASRRSIDTSTNPIGSNNQCISSATFSAYAKCWHGSSFACSRSCRKPTELVSSTVNESSDARWPRYEWRWWPTSTAGNLWIAELVGLCQRIALLLFRWLWRLWSEGKRWESLFSWNAMWKAFPPILLCRAISG